MALIDAAYDKDPNVRKSIITSLHGLGKKQPALVLSSCHSFLVSHAKVNYMKHTAIINITISISNFMHFNVKIWQEKNFVFVPLDIY